MIKDSDSTEHSDSPSRHSLHDDPPGIRLRDVVSTADQRSDFDANVDAPSHDETTVDAPSHDETTVDAPSHNETTVDTLSPVPMPASSSESKDASPSQSEDGTRVSDGPATTPITTVEPTGNDGTAEPPLDRADPLTWFAHQIGKPKDEDFAEMLRWTQKTLVDEAITEYQIRWINRAIPILHKLDSFSDLVNPSATKRTFLLLVAADYLHKPRYKVFQLPGTGSMANYYRWLKKPHIRAVYDELYQVMTEEILEHELSEIRKSVRVTRISAARAAEVRAELLDHPNPWVALQSARDIMQSADRQTAAKGYDNRNLTINASLTAEQLTQLLDRAGQELSDWDTKYMSTTADGRPLIIAGEVVDPPTPHTIIIDDEERPEGE